LPACGKPGANPISPQSIRFVTRGLKIAPENPKDLLSAFVVRLSDYSLRFIARQPFRTMDYNSSELLVETSQWLRGQLPGVLERKKEVLP
jgi:hypothetical protein